MNKLLTIALTLSTINCSSRSEAKPDAAPERNIARENAEESFGKDVKCDKPGFHEPTLHSVTCTLKNGVKVYCTAGITGTDCKPIFAPEEVLKAQAQAQQVQQQMQDQQSQAASAATPQKGKK